MTRALAPGSRPLLQVVLQVFFEVVQLQEWIVVVSLHHLLLKECLAILHLPHCQVAFKDLREELGITELHLILPISPLKETVGTD